MAKHGEVTSAADGRGLAPHDKPEPSTCTGLVGGAAVTPAASPGSLPSTSAEAIDSTGPGSAVIALLVALVSVAGLAAIGRTRRRSRTSKV